MTGKNVSHVRLVCSQTRIILHVCHARAGTLVLLAHVSAAVWERHLMSPHGLVLSAKSARYQQTVSYVRTVILVCLPMMCSQHVSRVRMVSSMTIASESAVPAIPAPS